MSPRFGSAGVSEATAKVREAFAKVTDATAKVRDPTAGNAERKGRPKPEEEAIPSAPPRLPDETTWPTYN